MMPPRESQRYSDPALLPKRQRAQLWEIERKQQINKITSVFFSDIIFYDFSEGRDRANHE